MKIKITKNIPIEKDLRPPIGSVHEVVESRAEPGQIYFIEYNGEKIGIYGRECEIEEE